MLAATKLLTKVKATIAVDGDRPEFQIKNLSDYLKEKRAENETAPQTSNDNEKDGMQIDCTEMEYFEERNELEARGDVLISTPSGVQVTADKAIYNKENNTIKLINNVELKKATQQPMANICL